MKAPTLGLEKLEYLCLLDFGVLGPIEGLGFDISSSKLSPSWYFFSFKSIERLSNVVGLIGFMEGLALFILLNVSRESMMTSSSSCCNFAESCFDVVEFF